MWCLQRVSASTRVSEQSVSAALNDIFPRCERRSSLLWKPNFLLGWMWWRFVIWVHWPFNLDVATGWLLLLSDNYLRLSLSAQGWSLTPFYYQQNTVNPKRLRDVQHEATSAVRFTSAGQLTTRPHGLKFFFFSPNINPAPYWIFFVIEVIVFQWVWTWQWRSVGGDITHGSGTSCPSVTALMYLFWCVSK